MFLHLLSPEAQSRISPGSYQIWRIGPQKSRESKEEEEECMNNTWLSPETATTKKMRLDYKKTSPAAGDGGGGGGVGAAAVAV